MSLINRVRDIIPTPQTHQWDWRTITPQQRNALHSSASFPISRALRSARRPRRSRNYESQQATRRTPIASENNVGASPFGNSSLMAPTSWDRHCMLPTNSLLELFGRIHPEGNALQPPPGNCFWAQHSPSQFRVLTAGVLINTAKTLSRTPAATMWFKLRLRTRQAHGTSYEAATTSSVGVGRAIVSPLSLVPFILKTIKDICH